MTLEVGLAASSPLMNAYQLTNSIIFKSENVLELKLYTKAL